VFIYFVPDQTPATVTPEALAAAGLATVFRDACESPRAFGERLIRRQVNIGPNGSAGLLLALTPADGRDPGLIACQRDSQRWIDCGGCWLGRAKDELPTPELLARPSLLPGPFVTLGDGCEWQVPIVRKLARLALLPRRMGYDAEGRFAMTVLPEFDAAWRASGEMFDHIRSAQPLDFEKVFALCVEVLALNYRIGLREAAELGLITTENYEQLYDAALDLAKVRELTAIDVAPEKKTLPGPSSSSPGPPVDSPITNPPAEICSSSVAA
jgi:hypothetical protein